MKNYKNRLRVLVVLMSMSFYGQASLELAKTAGKAIASNPQALYTAAGMAARAAGLQAVNYSSQVGIQPENLSCYAQDSLARNVAASHAIANRNFASMPNYYSHNQANQLNYDPRIQEIVDEQLGKGVQNLGNQESDRVGKTVYRSAADIYNPKNYGSSFMDIRLGMGGKTFGDRPSRMFSTSAKQRDPYEVLEVSRNATPAEIEAAYRRLVLLWHPDRRKDDRDIATAKTIELNVARDMLTGKIPFDKDRSSSGSSSQSQQKSNDQTYQAHEINLSQAVDQGNIDDVIYCIRKGSDVNGYNTQGQTPLTAAIKKCSVQYKNIYLTRDGAKMIKNVYFDIVKNLFEAGADINLVDQNGDSPLMVAIMNGKTEMARMLVANGADKSVFNAVDQDGNTMLMRAFKDGDLHRAKALLAADVDVSIKNKQGDTVLHIAIKNMYENGRIEEEPLSGWPYGYPDLIDAFAYQKISVFDKNNEGKSAVDLAGKGCSSSNRTPFDFIDRLAKHQGAELGRSWVKNWNSPSWYFSTITEKLKRS